MKKRKFEDFLKRFKKKLRFSMFKSGFKTLVKKIKDLSIANYKFTKLQKEIDEFDQNKEDRTTGEQTQEYLFLSSDLEDLSADIEQMIIDIYNETRQDWETIQTGLPGKNSNLSSELASIQRVNYWKSSFKIIFNHYLNQENEKFLKYKEAPFCFKYPILNRLFHKLRQ